MLTPKALKKRVRRMLLEWADYLATVPEDEWDMGTWGAVPPELLDKVRRNVPPCGTVGCAAFHASRVPSFRAAGLRAVTFADHPGEVIFKIRNRPGFMSDGVDAVLKALGLYDIDFPTANQDRRDLWYTAQTLTALMYGDLTRDQAGVVQTIRNIARTERLNSRRTR